MNMKETKTTGILSILPMELTYSILMFLLPMDQYRFGLTCKTAYITLLYYNVKHRNMRSALNRFVNDVDSFRHILCTANAIVSGSVVLHCIIGQQYSDSDLDIYVEGDNAAEPIQQFLIEQCDYSIQPPIITPRMKLIELRSNSQKIQIIRKFDDGMEISSLQVVNQFNATPVMNYWEPKNNYIMAYDICTTMNLKSHTRFNKLIDWNAPHTLCMNDKIMSFSSGNDRLVEYSSEGIDYTIRAMRKYIKRGFTFLNAPKVYLESYKQLLSQKGSVATPVSRDYFGYNIGSSLFIGDYEDYLLYKRFNNFSFRTGLFFARSEDKQYYM